MNNIERMKKWKADCYNPLSTNSSVDKLREAYNIISEILKAAEQSAEKKSPEDKF